MGGGLYLNIKVQLPLINDGMHLKPVIPELEGAPYPWLGTFNETAVSTSKLASSLIDLMVTHKGLYSSYVSNCKEEVNFDISEYKGLTQRLSYEIIHPLWALKHAVEHNIRVAQKALKYQQESEESSVDTFRNEKAATYMIQLNQHLLHAIDQEFKIYSTLLQFNN